MTDTPLVTVLVPAYNRVDFIDQTIRSVLAQNWPAVQLIVIDDGSDDGTLERIRSYDGRLLLLTHEGNANRGQSAALNLGLRHATGKYIAILDSDDYWAPDKLRVQVDYLEQHPDVGLVYSNGYGVDADGNILYPFHAEDHAEHNDPDRVLLDCYLSLAQSSLVRKSVYDRIGGFNEEYRAAQDHDMLIRMAEVTRLAYLPDFLWYYRRHAGSISSQRQDLRWRNGFRILDAARKRYPYRAGTVRKRKAVLNYRMGRVSLAQRSPVRAAACFAQALWYDPLRAARVVLRLDRSR